VFAILVGLVLVGCGVDGGDPDATVSDASVDGGGDGGPEIPWLDRGVPPLELAPCPSGWREVSSTEATTCDPYPEGGPGECAAGEAHFPGEPACRPLGDPCPAGEHAADLPADATVIYVSASASPGGEGTLASPYATLSEVGWTSLGSGDVVALGKGTHEGTLPLRGGVRVIGACAAETIVTGVDAPVLAVVTVTSAGEPAEVRNLTIADAPQFGVQLDSGALTLEGVAIERARGIGVVVSGTGNRLEARSILIRDTQTDAGDLGRGLHVQEGGVLDASQLFVVGNADYGLAVVSAGTVVTLADSVVRDTEARSDGMHGHGISAEAGARVDASRTLVESNVGAGVVSREADTQVSLADVVVRETRPRPFDEGLGRGIVVVLGGRVSGTRILVERNREAGISIQDAGSTVVLTDAVVRDTQPRAPDDSFGGGVSVQRGGRLEATRLFVARNHASGVSAWEATEVVLEDVAVHETSGRASDGAFGSGVAIQDGRLEARRLLIQGSRSVGLSAIGSESDATIADVVIRDTRPQESDLSYGYGISAQVGARVVGERVLVEDVVELGALASREASLELRDVVVANVARSANPDRGFGHGVAAVGGMVRLSEFRVQDLETCGLFLSGDGLLSRSASIDAASGTVQRAPIGACVQVDGYDLERISTDVVYRDNGVNLDSTTLPLPTDVEPIPSF